MQIELDRVTIQFGSVTAVDQLSAAFRSGELVALLGPSGCGKSTTLFALAGIYKPTSGEVRFDGNVVNKLEPEDREIGMVFQNYALYPHMTVLDNILFPLKMKRTPKREALERARAMADTVQIGHLLDRRPGQLSGGQQQRVAIARALVKEPRLLLLDEPLSNLDARLRLEMREEIRRIQLQVGITTVFVTHDQEEAMSIADRIVLLQSGKLQQDAAPVAMYREPANLFAAQFIGTPPMNVLDGALSADGRTAVLEAAEPGARAVKIGVRPEDWTLAEAGAGSAVATAVVSHVETIGRDTLLRAQIGATPVRLYVPQERGAEVGEALRLNVRPGKAHVFDPASGARLAGPVELRGGSGPDAGSGGGAGAHSGAASASSAVRAPADSGASSRASVNAAANGNGSASADDRSSAGRANAADTTTGGGSRV
ncbi:ABC transporter ATP-binding protein [Paenibacillus chartarius]|uniref:ABC transporter ATP-binding protein n=1 Tax=Paenibacillus chartarius TaxID=747481 RepID=A0ABV6DJ94_9BACL